MKGDARELLDRYLHAVRFWLPRAQQDDIIAELSEDLRSEIEEREGALGRPLNQVEVAGLLQRRGHPMRVATGFLPQRSLIGPPLYPIYVRVLKIVGIVVSAAWTVSWLAQLAFSPSWRAAHPGALVFETWTSFLSSVVLMFATVTLIFALLERTSASERRAREWDPRKLRPVRDPGRIPRGNSVAELAAGVVFLAWWALLPAVPSLEGDGVVVLVGPAWHPIYWMIAALVAAGLPLAAVNLVRPWWTRLRAGVRLALDLAGLVPVVVLLRTGDLVEVTSTRIPPAGREAIARAINGPVRLAVILLGVGVAAGCVRGVLRLARVRPAGGNPPGGSATASSSAPTA